jgi:hypothetical protein
MTWTFLTLFVSLSCDLIIICHTFVAFRRSKAISFLLITIASLLRVLINLVDQTIAKTYVSEAFTASYSLGRRLTHISILVLLTIGIVQIVRSNLKTPLKSG